MPDNIPPSQPLPLSEPLPGGYRRFVMPGLFVLLLFGVLIYRRPAKKTISESLQTWVFRGRIFGTSYMVKIVTHKKDNATKLQLQKQFSAKLREVDLIMSTYKKNSELSRFNRSKSLKPRKVSSALLHVIKSAQKISILTGGAFDITIGPVVNVWGFGPKKRIKPPSASRMAAAKLRVGYTKLRFNAKHHTIQKKVPSLYVDLSAIAKGYGVDVLGWTMEKAGFSNYMAEIGGEVRARGHNAQRVAWRVGIEKPISGLQRYVQLVVPLHNMSMATSGNYRNYITVSGKRVSHLIDARSGQPVSHNLASVSVVHPDCMTADALATAFYVLGPKDGLKLAEQQKLAVLFLVRQGKSFTSRSSSYFKALLRRR